MASRRKRGSRAAPSAAAVDGESLARPAPSINNGRQLRWIIATVLAIAAVYVILALSPSHYSIALTKLGVPTEPVWGTARQVRSDEWMVVTPLTQIALRGDFSPRNQISPYGESLHGFIALPINDWSVAFKPQLWAYWLLPPAYAFSLYWAILWTSMLFGYAFLLQRFGVPWVPAILGSAALWMSHYVQVWWTGPAPCFAFAPWPLVLFLARIPELARWLAFTYAGAVWVFSALYPPFLISTAFALLCLGLALRRDMFTLRSVSTACVAAAAVIGLVWANLHETIDVMRGTVYPGSRASDGGGVVPLRLLAFLLPFISTSGLKSLVPRLDECEVAVVSTLVPLLLLVFANHSSAIRLARVHIWALSITVLGLALMFAWMVLPIPSQIGSILLWNYVPPYRMVWAFGLVLTLIAVVVLSRVDLRISAFRVAVFSVVMLLSWVSSRGLALDLGAAGGRQAMASSWFEFVAVGLAVSGFCLMRILRRDASVAAGRTYVLTVAVATGVVTFGTYNPVQQAHVVFDIPDSPLQQQFREQARRNPNGWLVVPGTFGAVLNGAGIPSVTHTLTTPQLAFFRSVFPMMDADEFNSVFNRYGHTMMRREPVPRVLHQDIMGVPIEAFESPQPEAKRIGDSSRR